MNREILALAHHQNLLILKLARIRKRQKRRAHRWWVHPILQNRQELGEFHHLFPELLKYPDKFRNYFRMTKSEFYELLDLIKPR